MSETRLVKLHEDTHQCSVWVLQSFTTCSGNRHNLSFHNHWDSQNATDNQWQSLLNYLYYSGNVKEPAIIERVNNSPECFSRDIETRYIVTRLWQCQKESVDSDKYYCTKLNPFRYISLINISYYKNYPLLYIAYPVLFFGTPFHTHTHTHIYIYVCVSLYSGGQHYISGSNRSWICP